jgi:hypothetical protein
MFQAVTIKILLLRSVPAPLQMSILQLTGEDARPALWRGASLRDAMFNVPKRAVHLLRGDRFYR